MQRVFFLGKHKIKIYETTREQWLFFFCYCLEPLKIHRCICVYFVTTHYEYYEMQMELTEFTIGIELLWTIGMYLTNIRMFTDHYAFSMLLGPPHPTFSSFYTCTVFAMLFELLLLLLLLQPNTHRSLCKFKQGSDLLFLSILKWAVSKHCRPMQSLRIFNNMLNIEYIVSKMSCSCFVVAFSFLYV